MPPHWVADGEPMARSSLIRKVHDARDPSRHGILKSVDGTHEGISKNPGTYMRALREIAVLMAVPPHPYIVPLFDSLVTPEHVHLVIAQAPGKDLALYMKDHDDFMVRLLGQICAGSRTLFCIVTRGCSRLHDCRPATPPGWGVSNTKSCLLLAPSPCMDSFSRCCS